jgi:peptidoglycan/xylan/chitin deacetylase (PgdA/CDA1 family)
MGFPILFLVAHLILPLLGLLGVVSWPAVLVMLVALHLGVMYGSLWPRSRLLGPNLLRVGSEHHGGERVYLTFDDGPDAEVTPKVLDILDEAGFCASFFVVGEKVSRSPDLVRRMVTSGHRLENHSQHHLKRFSLLTPGQTGREIDEAQMVIQREAGYLPGYFRAPAGLRSPWVLPLLQRRGLRLVTWTRRGFDAVSRDPERVLARLTRGVNAGDILVLHDGGAALAADGKPVILHVLPRLLEVLRGKDLQPAPLPPVQAYPP